MSKPSFKENRRLNSLPKFKDLKCHHCGRSHPATILNIEAIRRDRIEPMCINRGSCNKVMYQNILDKVKNRVYNFSRAKALVDFFSKTKAPKHKKRK